MAKWNLPVDDDLDKQVFEAAHDTRVSKSQFIRNAVVEKLNKLNANTQDVARKLGQGYPSKK